MLKIFINEECSISEIGKRENNEVLNTSRPEVFSLVEKNSLDPSKLNFSFGVREYGSAVKIKEGFIFDGGCIIDTYNKLLLTEGFMWAPKFHQSFLHKNEDTDNPNIEISGISKEPLYRSLSKKNFVNAAFIGAGLYVNFGHWLMEFAPRIFMLKKVLKEKNISTVLISDNVPDRFLFFFENKLGKEISIERYSHKEVINFENLWVIESPVYRDKQNILHFNFDGMRETKKIVHSSIHSSNKENTILFLGRTGETHRNIINQSEIVSELLSLSDNLIEENSMHTKTMEEQINLIASSKMIIEAAGGTTVLTNNIISNRTPYLLLVTPDRTHDAGRKYMATHGISPGWLIGKNTSDEQKHFLLDKDLYFDKTSVLKSAKLMGSEFFGNQISAYSYI